MAGVFTSPTAMSSELTVDPRLRTVAWMFLSKNKLKCVVSNCSLCRAEYRATGEPCFMADSTATHILKTGGPKENRTPINGVTSRYTNHYTMRPY